jgi:hypothetical protein
MLHEAFWYIGIAFTFLIFLVAILHYFDDEDDDDVSK